MVPRSTPPGDVAARIQKSVLSAPVASRCLRPAFLMTMPEPRPHLAARHGRRAGSLTAGRAAGPETPVRAAALGRIFCARARQRQSRGASISSSCWPGKRIARDRGGRRPGRVNASGERYGAMTFDGRRTGCRHRRAGNRKSPSRTELYVVDPSINQLAAALCCDLSG